VALAVQPGRPKEGRTMVVFAVAFVVTAVVIAVILLGMKFRDTAFCPRRESLVDIVDGRCQYRDTTCTDAPAGCERQCITVDDFASRAA
jgi:hypothetical protein